MNTPEIPDFHRQAQERITQSARHAEVHGSIYTEVEGIGFNQIDLAFPNIRYLGEWVDSFNLEHCTKLRSDMTERFCNQSIVVTVVIDDVRANQINRWER
ncbi:hypothetical protein [Amycolatopsis anabasis]|uniref:hypothetical protein n=1 Tax=Amycolatopsis anabasis TaxID=1840409 RepID=UPI00131A74AA|nr:hypothetical protein [Amycolatopsis anabasis]